MDAIDDYFLYFDNANSNNRISSKLGKPKILFVGKFPFSDQKVLIVKTCDGKVVSITG